MKKFIKVLCLTFILGGNILAQTNSDEYKKNEYYVGYSNQQVDTGNRRSYSGFEVAYVRNVHRYFGLKGDFSGAYRNSSFQNTLTDQTNGTFSYRGDRANALNLIEIKNVSNFP